MRVLLAALLALLSLTCAFDDAPIEAATDLRFRIQNRCVLRLVRGFGSQRLPRFFFDFAAAKCRLFFYTGRGGNANNFPSRDVCEQVCLRVAAPQTEPLEDQEEPQEDPTQMHQEEPQEDATQMHQEEAEERAQMREEPNQAEERAQMRQEEPNQPEQPQDDDQPPDDRPFECNLPLKPGANCGRPEPRFFFNRHSQKCEKFDYTGCDGNANRFLTEYDCATRCLPNV